MAPSTWQESGQHMAPFEGQGRDAMPGSEEALHAVPRALSVPALPNHDGRADAKRGIAPPSTRDPEQAAPARTVGQRLRTLALDILPWASAVVSVVVFAIFLHSWQFATGIVALLFVHEMGHFLVFRLKGIRARWPIFIPLFGAFVMPIGTVQTAQDFAEIALAGPVLGGVGALICLLVAQSLALSSCQVSLFDGTLPFGSLYCLSTNQAFYWLGLATFGFFINLLNLIPVNPLDGGRVVGAISRWIWPVALVASIALAGIDIVQRHHVSIFWLTIGLAAIFGFGETVGRFRQAPHSAFYATPLTVRVWITVAYVAAGVLLAYGMVVSALMFDIWRIVW